MVEIIKVGKKALTDIFRAKLYMCQLEQLYEQFYYDFSNGYINWSREQPRSAGEANRLMEYFKLIVNHCRRNEELGIQYLLDGGKDKGFIYFRSERARNACKGANNCIFNRKVDRTDINSEEKIASKF